MLAPGPLASTTVLLPTLTGPTYLETHPLVVVCIVMFFGKIIKQVICTLILWYKFTSCAKVIEDRMLRGYSAHVADF